MKLALPALLVTASAALALGIVYEITAPLAPVAVDLPPSTATDTLVTDATPYRAPSADRFADIDARPVFNPTRRRLADTVTAGTASGAPSDLTLVGVMMSSERSVALLKSKSTSATTSVTTGDDLDGWRVVRIEPTMVSLRGAGGVLDVPLDNPGSGTPSPPLASTAPTPSAPASSAAQVGTAPAVPANSAAPKPVVPVTTAAMSAPSPKADHVRATGDGTIAPEALKGAPIDPRTGEPTL